MTQSKDGNGHGEYNPEVEFEYLAADVWIKSDSEGNRDVAYSEDVLEALEEEEDEESDSDDE
jgi:hypothetical protein